MRFSQKHSLGFVFSNLTILKKLGLVAKQLINDTQKCNNYYNKPYIKSKVISKISHCTF